MNDTSPEMDKMVAERYKLMTPDRRMRSEDARPHPFAPKH